MKKNRGKPKKEEENRYSKLTKKDQLNEVVSSEASTDLQRDGLKAEYP